MKFSRIGQSNLLCGFQEFLTEKKYKEFIQDREGWESYVLDKVTLANPGYTYIIPREMTKTDKPECIFFNDNSFIKDKK